MKRSDKGHSPRTVVCRRPAHSTIAASWSTIMRRSSARSSSSRSLAVVPGALRVDGLLADLVHLALVDLRQPLQLSLVRLRHALLLLAVKAPLLDEGLVTRFTEEPLPLQQPLHICVQLVLRHDQGVPAFLQGLHLLLEPLNDLASRRGSVGDLRLHLGPTDRVLDPLLGHLQLGAQRLNRVRVGSAGWANRKQQSVKTASRRKGEAANQNQQSPRENTSEPANLLALAEGHVPQLGVVAKQPPMLSHQRGVHLVLPAIHGLARVKSQDQNSEASNRLLRSRHEPRGLETGKDTGEKQKITKKRSSDLRRRTPPSRRAA